MFIKKIGGSVSHLVGAKQLYRAYRAYQHKNYEKASVLFKEASIRLSLVSMALGGGYFFRDEISNCSQKAYSFLASYFETNPPSLPLPPLDAPPLSNTTENETQEKIVSWDFEGLYWIGHQIKAPFVLGYEWIAYLVSLEWRPINLPFTHFCEHALYYEKNIDKNLGACQKTLLAHSSQVQQTLKERSDSILEKVQTICFDMARESTLFSPALNESQAEFLPWNETTSIAYPSKIDVYAACVSEIVQDEELLKLFVG